ncbi:hypothetical protein MN608_06062 [Microdochium nivale]|nr:hypothetical protein MN608_06062 [Microdochium nivale]
MHLQHLPHENPGPPVRLCPPRLRVCSTSVVCLGLLRCSTENGNAPAASVDDSLCPRKTELPQPLPHCLPVHLHTPAPWAAPELVLPPTTPPPPASHRGAAHCFPVTFPSCHPPCLITTTVRTLPIPVQKDPAPTCAFPAIPTPLDTPSFSYDTISSPHDPLDPAFRISGPLPSPVARTLP